MNHYNIYRMWKNSQANISTHTNKISAIKEARRLALTEKQSMIVVREEDDTPIAIAEFPYYLRGLMLSLSDITINLI